MNTYETTFILRCPVNNLAIHYRLTISTPERMLVEDMLQAVSELPTQGFHEDIADAMAKKLPGRQILRAHHHGVDIVTERGGA